MDLVEKYNIELKGCRFRLKYDTVPPIDIYLLSDISYINGIYQITILNTITKNRTNMGIESGYYFIESGKWILDKNSLRKKKLQKLINGFNRKI